MPLHAARAFDEAVVDQAKLGIRSKRGTLTSISRIRFSSKVSGTADWTKAVVSFDIPLYCMRLLPPKTDSSTGNEKSARPLLRTGAPCCHRGTRGATPFSLTHQRKIRQ
jgi:hypothetical protein